MIKKLLKFTSYLILLLFALGLLFQKPIRITIADVLYDNRIHLTACKDLFDIEIVEQAISNNKNLIQLISMIDPDGIHFEVGIYEECPGKGDIIVSLPNNLHDETIEGLTENDFLFGVTYRIVYE